MRGRKTGGRRKGTPNKVTAEARAVCAAILRLFHWVADTERDSVTRMATGGHDGVRREARCRNDKKWAGARLALCSTRRVAFCLGGTGRTTEETHTSRHHLPLGLPSRRQSHSLVSSGVEGGLRQGWVSGTHPSRSTSHRRSELRAGRCATQCRDADHRSPDRVRLPAVRYC